jgi:hypothetical protein
VIGWWVGVAVEEFFGVMGMVDLRWCGGVGPGQAAGVGDGGLAVAVGEEFVVGGQAKNSLSASVAPPSAQAGLWWTSL